MRIKEIFRICNGCENAGNTRSEAVIKNVIASFFLKGWYAVVQFLLIPLALHCLSNYEFGVWLTISSLFVWIDNCDIGLGNGLRNKLTESIANGDISLAKRQVSTTFVMLTIISVLLIVISNAIIFFGDIFALLNVDRRLIPNLPLVCSLLFSTACFTFVAKGLNSFLLALQKTALTNLIQAVGGTFSLAGIATLAFVGSKSFLWVTGMFTAMPLLSFLCFSLYFFGKKYKYLRPSVSEFDWSQVKSLMSLGVKIFIGQLSGIVLLFTANLIISKIISPAAVTPYQIVCRYFSLILIPMTLIFTPIWSATTDAYVKNDIEWIRSMMIKFRIGIVVVGAVLVCMVVVSDAFIQMWVGNKVDVDFALRLVESIYTFIFIWGMFYSNIIYGIGKVSFTVFTVFVMAILFVIFAFPVTKAYGVVGLVVLQTLICLVTTLQQMVQCTMIINNTARGLFNR